MENSYDDNHDFIGQLNEQENRLKKEGSNVDLADKFDPISAGASASFQYESDPEDDFQAKDDSLDIGIRAQHSAPLSTGQAQEDPPINEKPTINPVNEFDVMTSPNFHSHGVQDPIVPTMMPPIEAFQVNSTGPVINPATAAQSDLDHKRFMPAQGQPLECCFPGCTQGGFSRRDNLERHIMTRHTQEQGVVCSICNRRFSRRDNYRKHATKCRKKRNPKAQSHSVHVQISLRKNKFGKTGF